jgi:ubiquinol oxidase
LVKVVRTMFDLVSGYKQKDIPAGSNMSVEELRAQSYTMSPEQWISRMIFLESIAAVPGMVAATVRHLRSLRLMRRDSGWIHTLLEEAENERMHLM